MSEFLLGAAFFLLITVAGGLVRVVLGPDQADKMMAAQLLSSGGIAILLIVGVGLQLEGAIDVALVVALLAAFAAVAFVKGTSQAGTGDPEAVGVDQLTTLRQDAPQGRPDSP